jgi:hypothetical protein
LLIAGFGLGAVQPTVAQSGPVLVPGVSEPPEMRGSPKSFTEPSPADTAFFDVLKQAGKGFTDVNLPLLDKFIVDYPTYANAYYWRANAEACGIKPSRLLFLIKAIAPQCLKRKRYFRFSPRLRFQRDILPPRWISSKGL